MDNCQLALTLWVRVLLFIFALYTSALSVSPCYEDDCVEESIACNGQDETDHQDSMVEMLWEKFSLFINFENFLDTRQTRFDSIYTGTGSLLDN